MALVLRPRILALIFGAYFIAVSWLAVYAAFSVGAPAYSPDISRWVYGVSAIAAANLLAVLLGIAALRPVATTSLALADVARAPPPTETGDPPVPKTGTRSDQEIDQILEGLDEIRTVAASEVIPEASEEVAPSIQLAAEPVSPGTIANSRVSDFAYVAGPIFVALAVLALAAILLPLSDALLSVQDRWNATFILAFSFAWAGLGAYAIASVYALGSR